MYLKTLVLKGFKSFADRSVLSLEPGITAVVGPNGSGKSNISDAVLWVLGERNAKNLRGQVMEDVIFAGSSARKSVRVAEVELVLDNSDGALPIDYAEVSIARRMYRSGESEYLINGSLARRMDVLDILHDSGLGTGTHSIISQGHLDSILQSKPEDRRALIEEAAGVLKHKQRKAKSARKIEQMDAHLARVKDVVAEVERQLGPLQRKAKRAIAYQEASAELAQASLVLAVDDLRILKRRWAEVCAREEALVADVERGREAVLAAEAETERLQEVIRRESADTATISQRRQRATTIVERLDACSRVVLEKRASAVRRIEELEARMRDNAAKRVEMQASRDEACARSNEASRALEQADAKVDSLFKEHARAVEQRAELERDVFAKRQEKRDADREADRLREELRKTREKLTGLRGKSELLEERAAEVNASLASSREAAASAADEFDQVVSAIAAAEAAEANARETFERVGAERTAARAARDAAYDKVRAVEAEIRGLEEIERAITAAAGAASAWLANHPDAVGDRGARPFARAITVELGFEPVVETVLGFDANAFVVADTAAVSRAARALAAARVAGEVSLAPCSGSNASRAAAARDAAARCGGYALIDKVHAATGMQGALDALVSDIVVCPDEERALAAHESDREGLRFATAAGFTVWPSGKVTLGATVAADGEGVIARARQLAEARETRDAAAAAQREAEAAYARADEAAGVAREVLLSCQQELSRVRGQKSASENARRAADARLASLESEHAGMTSRRQETAAAIAETEPLEARLAGDLVAAEVRCDEAQAALGRAQSAVAPARDEEVRLERALSDAKLESATLKERVAFAVRSLETIDRQLAAFDEEDASARAQVARYRVVEHRAAPLLDTIGRIETFARRCADALADREREAYAASTGTHEQNDAARLRAKEAHDALDALNDRLTQARVEKSRLEVQVEAGVSTIVHDCGTPLETALALPEIEDRPAIEEEAFRLRRRIANMGSINPDAAAEYEQVKTRYDFLAAQLADLDSARTALAKIDRVIDERMKMDFIATFADVNSNFQQIFGILFPGGSAELTLTDPDDLENTGVEVSAQPRGKKITKMSLMSGGEKSLVAIALLFAAYRIRSAPFYILDEVEAALDDTNLRRLTGYIATLRDTTQLIMITHQRRTMEMADVLFGVSMQADGVTKVISQRLENALRYAE